jgi:thiol:disulfide interchange protein DsbD
MADQTYHWGLLDREIYLAIWIVVFTLLGFYLLGKLKFAHDDDVPHISVTRLSLAIVVFSFVVYMVPGMWGAPLSGLSGYLPPISTQDFVLTSGKTAHIQIEEAPQTVVTAKKYDFLHLPHKLQGYFDLEEGLAEAQRTGKPVFVDVTGHACVNCREMEERVWSDPKALELLRNEYVIVALYVDDKHKLDKEDWVTDAGTGKVYKDLGRVNSYIAREKFGVNAQPNYILLSPEGEILAPARGYDLSVDGFVNFLKGGIEANK